MGRSTPCRMIYLAFVSLLLELLEMCELQRECVQISLKKAWKNLCKIVHSTHCAKLHSFGSNRQWSPHAPVVYVAIFTGPSHLSCLGIQITIVKMKSIMNVQEGGIRSGSRFCSQWITCTLEMEKYICFKPDMNRRNY